MARTIETEAVRKYAAANGMMIDEQALADARDLFAEYDAPQALFDRASVHHTTLVNHYFTPRSWSYWQRVKIAAMFIFGRR